MNLSSGDVYVVDQFGYRVERFDAAGNFLGAFGWGVADGSAAAQTCTSACQPGIAGSGDGQFDTPQGIAIDQSDGSVYIVDGNNNRVEEFDASGTYVSQFGSAGSGDGQFSGPQGIAVDPSDGSVYVADTGDHRVEKFDNTGSFVSQFGSEGSGDGQFEAPTRVAADSTGRVYVLDIGNGRIERFTSAGAFDQVFAPTDVFLPQEIAVDPGDDHLYVAQWPLDFSEQHIVEFDPTGNVVDTHGVGSGANNSSGLALNAAGQRIYLADGFNARVLILGDVVAPSATIAPATNVTSTSASLSGTVNPNGNSNVGWHFELSTDDATWTPATPDFDAFTGTTPVPVSQDLTDLLPGTHYFARLAATRPANPPAYSSEIQFTTTAIGPDATTDVADDVTPNHAVLTGLVNPHHSPTTYYFQWGRTTSYGHSAPGTQDADAGAANHVGQVLQRVDHLAPGTTYHYRLVATNQAATVHGTDQTFATTTSPNPSPRRAWEKVSPNSKGGADVMADNQRARVSTDGNAASFASLGAFGDAVGTTLATDYLSVRSGNHWTTHAITPGQQPPTAHGLQARYAGAFSDDLSKGTFLAASPLTGDPNVANVPNVYLRNDLRTPGQGAYALLSSCPLCASTSTPLPPLPPQLHGDAGAPFVAGASADFGHVIFESQQPLTADAPSGCTDLRNIFECPGNLYEWDHGTLRLAGVLPDNFCGSPPCASPQGSQAGQGAGGFQGAPLLTPHTISADGSRIFFTVPDSPGAQSGALYMRVNHATTAQVNASERVGPDPSGPQPATYWDASTDGSRVFFSTAEALTDDAPISGQRKLYMYDASLPDSSSHNLTLISTDNEPNDPGDVVAVQGASADGHYVYFGAVGQLVAGQPFLDFGRALYVWHDGSVRYIASIEPSDFDEDSNTVPWVLGRTSVRVTPDGSRLLFRSTADRGPTGYQQNGNAELYLYSYASRSLACVSCDPSGAPATAGAFTTVRANTGGAATTSAQSHPLSDDGHDVFFSSGQALVPHDVNRSIDVYGYDVSSGTIRLITSGTDGADSYFMNASSSGRDAFFLTREQLIKADGDGNYDLYDARVNGG